MIFNVCAVTSTRAEYGLLRLLLLRLEHSKNVQLDIIVTGTHLIKSFGYTKKEIINDGYKNILEIFLPMYEDTQLGMVRTTSRALEDFSKIFSKKKYDLLIVLGDRFEILAAVVAAHLMGVAVAHISGGDITEGAIDDAIRHCITKISHLHFPGCSQSAQRVIQMGEQPSMVHNVGEPGVENCLQMKLMSRLELSNNLNFTSIMKEYSVVTFHPVTMELNTAENQVIELIEAMNQFPQMSYIITMSNADAGGRKINDIWTKESKAHSNWLLVPSLGVLRYLSAIKYAKLVIGNSSSGIVEAPSIGTPTINIGDRQKGRMMADSVINCFPNVSSIVTAMRKGLTDEFQNKSKNIVSPFGDGKTSEKIENVIMEYLKSPNKTLEKKFYDIDFK